MLSGVVFHFFLTSHPKLFAKRRLEAKRRAKCPSTAGDQPPPKAPLHPPLQLQKARAQDPRALASLLPKLPTPSHRFIPASPLGYALSGMLLVIPAQLGALIVAIVPDGACRRGACCGSGCRRLHYGNLFWVCFRLFLEGFLVVVLGGDTLLIGKRKGVIFGCSLMRLLGESVISSSMRAWVS